jgi:hypothetical protein
MANEGIVGSIQDTQTLKNVDNEVAPIFKIFTEDIHVDEHSTILKSRSISGNTLIWGSTSKAWGTPYQWNSAIVTDAFILGNVSSGRLGTDELGETLASFQVIGVTNPNNIYKESLRTDTFKDTSNTTATWDTTNFRWTFTTGQVIQTLAISKDATVTITNATLSIESSQITNPGNLTFFLSADGGSNFEQVTNGVNHLFTNTGTELRLKITASGSAQIDVDDSDENSFPVEVRVNQ